MTIRGIRNHIGLAVFCLLVTATPNWVLASTPAGTQIQANSTAKYYTSSNSLMPVATSNTVVTTVGQSAAVSVSPTSDTQSTDANNITTFALTVTNKGNGSDTFDLTNVSSSGSIVTIYKDDNGDGQRQSTEVTKVTATTTLAPDANFKCLVLVQTSSAYVTDTVKFTARSRADVTKSADANLIAQGKSPYIITWLVNGYYSNTNNSTRLSQDYLGGEANVIPSKGSMSDGKIWNEFTSPTTPMVDFVTAFGAQKYVAAYAHIYVYSPVVQKTGLWLGSDNGIKIWLNGTNVWTNDSTRGLTPDQDRLTVNLNQGWNRLLVKVSQYGGKWGFTAKFCDGSGNAVPGLEYSLNPPAPSDTTPPSIANVVVTPGSTTATVEWDTDEEADSTAIYGTTVDLSQTIKDATMVLHHKMILNNLIPNTTYGFKVRSIDASGNYRWVGPGTFTTAVSQNATKFIQSWLINGFYKNSDRTSRMTTDYLGGETVMAPLNGDVSGGNTWTAYDSPDAYIDLGTGFGNPTGCAGYAFAYVYSPVAQNVNIWAGSDDGIKIWVNGSVVWNNDTYRSMMPDQDKTTANLSAGWNRLLVKITQGGSGWGFTLRICDPSGNQISGIYYAIGS